jgi:hypothetical protein
VKLTFIDWIWRIRGSLPVQPPQSSTEAFGRLDSLLQEKNTTYRIDGDTLTFSKKAQLPQDKMSVFDGGTWRIANGVMWYDMTSRALLACFLAPLFFLAAGYIGVAADEWRNPPEVVKAKAEAAKKRSKVKAEDVPMSAIDEFLGAPKPEVKKKGGEEIGKRNRKPSMTTAYVFMGIFFALWVAGRILEHKLIHSRFRKKLAGEDALQGSGSGSAPAGSVNAGL